MEAGSGTPNARVTAEEKELCARAAEIEEREFSDWVRRTLIKRARAIVAEEERGSSTSG